MMDTAADDDDPRLMELETLAAIFPEIRHSQEAIQQDSTKLSEYIVELELPVEPNKPVTVVFPAASSASSATHATSATCDGQVGDEAASTATLKQAVTTAPEPLDTLLVSHLPPLCVKITLPDGYPLEEAPFMSLATEPSWLASTALRALEDDGPRLWEEAGRDMVAYTYIDHLQREAEHVFGALSAEGVLEMDPEHKIAVLDFDLSAKRAAFEKQTFECGICLDPKKGVKCHKMMDCGHVFCLQCLQDFYNDAIKEGGLSTVRCLTPNCAKERAASSAGKAANVRATKSKTLISPSELLQIGLTEETVKRYVKLKYKTELEADKDTIYCPRQWCNGAARSKKHKKPQLDFTQSQGSEEDMANRDSDHGQASSDIDDVNGNDEQTTESINATKKFQSADLLCVCEDCGLAFCGRCLQTWHGEFVRCTPKRDKDELTEEEKASLEYVQLHTSPCPTCNAPAQKTHGCNHMICSRCDSHFCYLCSSWLDPANPYMHYNSQSNGKVTSCYQRLWELEGGDGDDVGLGFIGGREPGGGVDVDVDAAAAAAAAIALAADEFLQLMPEIEEPGTDGSEGEGEDEEALPHQLPVNLNGNPVAIAREAPLVLRLLEHRPRREPAPQPQPQPQPRRQPQPQRRQPQPQPHRGQPGGRGRGRGRDRA